MALARFGNFGNLLHKGQRSIDSFETTHKCEWSVDIFFSCVRKVKLQFVGRLVVSYTGSNFIRRGSEVSGPKKVRLLKWVGLNGKSRGRNTSCDLIGGTYKLTSRHFTWGQRRQEVMPEPPTSLVTILQRFNQNHYQYHVHHVSPRRSGLPTSVCGGLQRSYRLGHHRQAHGKCCLHQHLVHLLITWVTIQLSFLFILFLVIPSSSFTFPVLCKRCEKRKKETKDGHPISPRKPQSRSYVCWPTSCLMGTILYFLKYKGVVQSHLNKFALFAYSG